MYGANNIFDRNNSSINNYSSSNGYNSSSSRGYSREIPTYGSNRLEYTSDVLSRGVSEVVIKWKEQVPLSISCRLETLHLHPIEMRLEDYYLMRTDKLRSNQKERVNEAIRKECFNEELLKIESHRLPPVSNEKAMDLDALRQTNRGGGYGTSYGSSGNSSNNIFSNNTASSTNIFSRNSQGNSGGNASNNVFMNSSNSGNTNRASNIFGSSDGRGQQSTNIFSGSNSGGNNTFQNSVFSNNRTSNFPGGNNSGNNSSSNIFSNNRNQGGSSNIFSNQGGQGNNIFGSNNYNANNSNNSNIPFNNNSQGNNPFQSNSLFNNGNNQSNCNYQSNSNNQLFSNQQVNQQDLNMFMCTVQNYIQTTQQYIQDILYKKKDARCADQETQNQDQNYVLTAQRHPQKDLFDCGELNLSQIPPWDSLPPRQTIVYVAPKKLDKWKQKGPRLEEIPKETQALNHSYLGRPVHSRIYHEGSEFDKQNIHMNSRSINQRHTAINRTIRDTDNYGSMIYSRCATKKQDFRLERPCKITFKLQVVWLENLNNKDKRKNIQPFEVEGRLELPALDLETQEGTMSFTREIAQDETRGIRMDASLKIDIGRSKIDSNFIPEVLIFGKVQQRLVNITSTYQVFYSRVKDGKICDFTINRSDVGTVAWNNPIPFKQLDFKRNYYFCIEDNTVECQLPCLQSLCRVKFCKPPQFTLRTIKEKGIQHARKELAHKIAERREGLKFGELWENGEWCLIFENGFR